MKTTDKSTNKISSSTARRYDDDFKIGAVRLVLEQKIPVIKAAKDLGIAPDTLRYWIKAKSPDSSSSSHDLKALQSEIKSLKKKLLDQSETIDILKKAAAIFIRP